MNKRQVQISKFLSYVLRHRPDQVGLTLDEQGWEAVDDLLAACARHGRSISRAELETVVATNDKQRFAFSADGLFIRASQGHSVAVDLGYEAADPPPLLYHGTAARNLASIRRTSLRKGRRHHVHLSGDPETARSVGSRYGTPVVLTVGAAEMASDGMTFYRSANDVWLTDHVPVSYIQFPQGSDIATA